MISLIALAGFPPKSREIHNVLKLLFGDALVSIEGVGEHAVQAEIGGARVKVAGTSQRIPREILEIPCSVAWYWPQAAEVFHEHQSQIAVVVEGDVQPLPQAMLLTRLVHSLGAAFDYLGVYWDNANMVHSPQAFTDAAAEMTPKNLPLRLWVDFRFFPEPDDTMSLVTVGLVTLGAMEIEIRKSRQSPQSLLRHAYNAACFLADGGRLPDDQTVGPNDDERVLVKHEPSMLEPGRMVHSLKL